MESIAKAPKLATLATLTPELFTLHDIRRTMQQYLAHSLACRTAGKRTPSPCGYDVLLMMLSLSALGDLLFMRDDQDRVNFQLSEDAVRVHEFRPGLRGSDVHLLGSK